jgi:hypothetical protein
MTATSPRRADYPIEPIFLERWSPRAFSADAISEADLHSVFEAARWAPSASNLQPWRFFYARRNTPAFATFLGLLVPGNQAWAKNAAALMILASQKSFIPPGKSEPVESRTHSFDTGAAWGFLALQALRLGYVTHAMAGFDVPPNPRCPRIIIPRRRSLSGGSATSQFSRTPIFLDCRPFLLSSRCPQTSWVGRAANGNRARRWPPGEILPIGF